MVAKSKAPTTLEEEAEAPAAAGEDAAAPAEAAAPEAAEEEGKKTKAKKTPKAKKGKTAAVTAEGDAPADGDAAAAEGDGEKKKKKKKKVVPSWATLSTDARSKLAKGGSLAKPKVQDAILEAIKVCGDSKGVASASSIKSMVMSDNPDLPKMVLKKGLAKAVDRGLVIQVKGKGFSGSFKLGKGKAVAAEKKAGKGKKEGKVASKQPKLPLEELFPRIFTWATDPKEASVGFIKKYLVAHYPDLDLGEDNKQLRKALELAEKNGTLERLSGKGYSGTFQLVDGASKSGAKFEDAFENACIAMNEPKELSVGKLRDYLGCYHQEYNTDNKPKVVKSALDRAVSLGWLNQISGKGFTGTFRLVHPYYPGPRELWGEDYVEPKAKGEVASPKKKAKGEEASPKKKATKRKAADSDSEEEEDEEDEEAYKPKAKKRGTPTARSTAAPVKKAKKSKPAKKERAARPVVAKKSKPGKARGRK